MSSYYLNNTLYPGITLDDVFQKNSSVLTTGYTKTNYNQLINSTYYDLAQIYAPYTYGYKRYYGTIIGGFVNSAYLSSSNSSNNAFQLKTENFFTIGGDYNIDKDTSSLNCNYSIYWNAGGNITFKNATAAYVLVVGGGGAGGGCNDIRINDDGAGGGGAGGSVEAYVIFKPNITYNITIGSGGVGSTTTRNSGSDSQITSTITDVNLIGKGGGAGGMINGGSGGVGGGCGGGACGFFMNGSKGGIVSAGTIVKTAYNDGVLTQNNFPINYVSGSTITLAANSYGNVGGDANVGWSGGGGGGVSGVGSSNSENAGNGGAGRSWYGISYGGGGGGGIKRVGGTSGGTGGTGGGGNGGLINSGGDSANNYGSGGGGTGASWDGTRSRSGGNGSKGIVCLKF